MCVHGLNVGVIGRGTAGGREPVVLFFAIDLVVHLTLAARLEVDNAHDPSASRDEHLLRLAEASGIDDPSCTAGNCIEKGCRRAVVYRKVA